MITKTGRIIIESEHIKAVKYSTEQKNKMVTLKDLEKLYPDVEWWEYGYNKTIRTLL